MATDDEFFSAAKVVPKTSNTSDDEFFGGKETNINEQHPDVPRTFLMNLAPNSRVAAQYLREHGFEVNEKGGDFNFDVRKPGEKVWRKLDPAGFDWKDLSDIGTDVGKGVAAGVGGILGGGAGLATGPGAVATGAAGAAAGAGLAEVAKQGLGKALGFKQTLGEAARDVGTEALLGGATEGVLRGVASAAKPLVQKLGTANPLRIPYAAEKAFTGSGKEIALRNARGAVDIARSGLDEANIGWEREAARRVAGLPETMVQGAKTATEAAERAVPKAVAGVEAEGVARMTPEAIEQAMKEQHEGTLRFLTHLINPVWGVKAANLKYVPELRSIAQKHLGGLFRHEFGSEAMATADQFVKRLGTELPQEELDKIALNLGKDLGQWMLGGERKAALSVAELEAATRLAKGAATETDAKAIQSSIAKTLEMPREVSGARQNVIDKIREMRKAKAEVAKGTPWTRAMEEYMPGGGGRELRRWLGAGYTGTIGIIPRAADIAGRVSEAVLRHSVPKGIRVAGKPYAQRVIPNEILRAILQGRS
jgi:hypothetical protein